MEAEQHVTAAEAYPFMQSPDWSQSAVLTAKKLIDKLDPSEVKPVVALIEEAGNDVKLGLEIAQRVAEAPREQREWFVRLSESSDERERNDAATWAAKKAPMPDPRLTIYRGCILDLERSLKTFPTEPENEEVRLIIIALERLCTRLKDQHREKGSGTTHA